MTVCLVCGDIGLEVALDLCHKCQQYGCHRYCQKELPKVLHEASIWLCEDCEPEDANPKTQFYSISDALTISEFGIEKRISEDWNSQNESECIEKDDENDENDHDQFSYQKLEKRRRLSLEEEEEEEEEEEASSLIFDDFPKQVKYPNIMKETSILGSQANTDEIICEEIQLSVEQMCREACNSEPKLKQRMDNDMYHSDTKLTRQWGILRDDKALPSETSGDCFGNVNPLEILQQELVSEKMGQLQDDVYAVTDTQYTEEGVNGPTLSSESYGVPSKDTTTSYICDQKLLKNQRAESKVLLDKRGNGSDTVKQMTLVPDGDDSKSTEKSDCNTNVPRRGISKKKRYDEEQKFNGREGFVSEILDVEITKTPRVSLTGRASTNLSEQEVIISGSVAKQEVKMSDNGSHYKAKKLKEVQGSELSKVPVIKADPSHISQEKETSGYEVKDQKTREKGMILNRDKVEPSGKYQLSPNDTAPLQTIKEKIITCSEATIRVHTPGNESRRRERCDKDEGGESKASKARRVHHKPRHLLDKRFSDGYRVKKPWRESRDRGQKQQIQRGSDLEGDDEVCVRYRGMRDESPRRRREQVRSHEYEDDEPPNTSRRTFDASAYRRRYEHETARRSDLQGPIVTSGFSNEAYQYRVPSDYEAFRFYHHDSVPMQAPIWNGTLKISQRGLNFHKRSIDVHAHLSSLADYRVSYLAQILPKHVLSSTFRQSQLWPRALDNTGLNSHHIALYFFPSNPRHMCLYDELINHMYQCAYALVAVFENEELVVFTSHVLPLHCQKIDSKFFLWGGFRTRGRSMVTDQLMPQPYAFGRA